MYFLYFLGKQRTIVSMHGNPYIVHKNEGETLKELLERFRREHPHLKDEKITYAGRLDPMAKGVMILLAGDDVHHKETYLNKDKIYDIEVLFGIATDTGDILGTIEDVLDHGSQANMNDIKEVIHACIGAYDQPYPLYSSKTVHGIPLWQYARNATSPIEIPTKPIEVYDIHMQSITTLSGRDIYDRAIHRIQKINGDFRQEEILTSWEQLRANKSLFTSLQIRVHASSGTYMRTLAERIGAQLHMPALAWGIERIAVGSYLKGKKT